MNGHFTMVDNAFLDALVRMRLSGLDMRVLLVIVRQTAGYRRQQARLTTSFLQGAVGSSARGHINDALRDLIGMNIVQVGGTGRKRKFSLNGDPASWRSYPKREHDRTPNGNMIVPQTGTRSYPKRERDRTPNGNEINKRKKEKKLNKENEAADPRLDPLVRQIARRSLEVIARL